MPTSNYSDPFSQLDDIILDIDTTISETVDYLSEEVVESTPIYIQLAEGETDPRLKLLSHSSRTTLHKCPRKYQLYRLASQQISLADAKEIEQGVTFAYGTVVGVGIQSILEGKTKQQVYLDMFLAWDVDLLDENPKQKKSFWEATFAIDRFLAMKNNGYLDDYELVYYEGKPAVELSFQIILPDGFRYRGFVDAVLRHKITREVLVLECKTSSANPNSATFKNSGQAIGYSIVLDILFPELSSYAVLYLVYATKDREYVQFNYTKSLLQRALWLQELLIDKQMIELYEDFGVYPTHGESCFDFFRECEYLSLCYLDTDKLTKALTQDILNKIEEDADRYMFTVDFFELVESQIKKGEL